MVDSASFVSYDFVSNKVIAEEGHKNEQLLTFGKAILQAASKDFKER
jgi:hypothetical protein